MCAFRLTTIRLCLPLGGGCSSTLRVTRCLTYSRVRVNSPSAWIGRRCVLKLLDFFLAILGSNLMRAGVALVRAALVSKRQVRVIVRSRTPFRIRVGSFSLAGVGSSRSLAQYWSPRARAYNVRPGASRYWVVLQSPSPHKGIRRWIPLGKRDSARRTGFGSHRLCGTIVSRDSGRV